MSGKELCFHGLRVLFLICLCASSSNAYAGGYPAVFQKSADSPFGIVFNQDPGREGKAFAALEELGIKWVRVLIRWSALEPARGLYDEEKFNELDQFVEKLIEETINIVGFVSSGSVPLWALQGDIERKKKGFHNPKARRKAIKNTPPKPEDLKDFLGVLMNRYRGKIKNWIVLNEVVGRESKVTPRALREIMKVVYKRAKDVDPNCNVIMAGIGGPKHYEAYYDQFFSLGGGGYVDVINRHMYRHLSRIPREIPKTREIMVTHGLDKPIQIGEFANPGFSDKSVPSRRTSAGPWNYPEGSLDAQAQLLVKRMVLSLANGVEKMFQSRIRDKALPTEKLPKESGGRDQTRGKARKSVKGHYGWMKWSKGIVDLDYNPKPAFYAYRTLIQKLDRAHFEGELYFGEDLRVFVFERRRRPIVVFWAWGNGDKNAQISLNVRGQELIMYDKVGKELKKVNPQAGEIKLTLTPDPMYLEGAFEVHGGSVPPPYEERYK